MRVAFPVTSTATNALPAPLVSVQVQVPELEAIFVDKEEIVIEREGNTGEFGVANVGDLNTLLNFRIEIGDEDNLDAEIQ